MSDDDRDFFVSVRVHRDRLELIQLRLWELGATGLEERDRTTLIPETSDEQVTVIAAFPDEHTAHRAQHALGDAYEAELVAVPRRNWAIEWRRGFGQQRIGRILLHPSWEPVEAREGDVVLTIDPENAFGSGDHETTRLVLRLLDERVRGDERVLDVGCGTGILSLAALGLGAARCIAIDVEEDAIAAADRNARRNGAGSRFDASTTPLAEVKGTYDLILANIETRVLVHMPAALRARMAEDATLILSGVLRTEQDELLAAFSTMSVEEVLEEGEWCALVLRERAG